MMKRSVIYDIISLVLLVLGLTSCMTCGWFGLQGNWKLACLCGVLGLASLRLSHAFVRTAIAVSGRSR
ncbi:MAG: hypothetical protein IIY06_03605 [Proteobacteria bacterium]|nr:hypothetical protein [Pseudomonadota bacterium]